MTFFVFLWQLNHFRLFFYFGKFFLFEKNVDFWQNLWVYSFSFVELFIAPFFIIYLLGDLERKIMNRTKIPNVVLIVELGLGSTCILVLLSSFVDGTICVITPVNAPSPNLTSLQWTPPSLPQKKGCLAKFINIHHLLVTCLIFADIHFFPLHFVQKKQFFIYRFYLDFNNFFLKKWFWLTCLLMEEQRQRKFLVPRYYQRSLNWHRKYHRTNYSRQVFQCHPKWTKWIRRSPWLTTFPHSVSFVHLYQCFAFHSTRSSWNYWNIIMAYLQLKCWSSGSVTCLIRILFLFFYEKFQLSFQVNISVYNLWPYNSI